MELLALVTYIVGVPLFLHGAYLEFTNKENKSSSQKHGRWLMGIFMAGFVIDGIIFFLEYFQ